MVKRIEVADKQSDLAIYRAQKAVFENALKDESLDQTMSVLCQRIEALLVEDRAVCSILLLKDGCLQHCAAPSLPEAYCDKIDGLPIGEGVGSCGTALFRKHQVIVEDIASDPLWAQYKDLALSFGLRACWSTPILNATGQALASFAVYYPTKFSPTPFHLALINEFCALAQLVVTHQQLIAKQKRLTGELKDTSSRLSAIMAVMPDLGSVLDSQGNVLEIFGDVSHLDREPDALRHHGVAELLGKQTGGRIIRALHETCTSGESQVLEYELQDADGRRVFEARTALLGAPKSPGREDEQRIVCMARDITDRKLAEEEAALLAMYDSLTGLPNRRHMQEALERFLGEVERQVYAGAVVFLDLDDFKRINDLLGHQKGDELLKMASSRLKNAIRRSELVARLGGDEFVVLLREPLGRGQSLVDKITAAAERLTDAFCEPFVLAGSSYKITPSLGVAIIEQADMSAEELLRRADAAMYEAKKAGGNRFRFYEASIQREAQRRLTLERDMVTALQQGRFCAWFQPQVNSDGEPIGVEALMRWRGADGTYVSPADFIPVAEHSGLIHGLQGVVLEQSCQLLVSLRERFRLSADFSVAINISPTQFGRGDLSKRLTDALQAYGLPPHYFTLEITENLVMEDHDEIHREMTALREQGFRFSIDDFGTGYSSLAYLHRLPVDELKIDKRFVDEMGQSDAGEPIVDSIIALSNNLAFKVVAEGVETQQQAAALCAKSLSALQGFFFARPMPVADLLVYFESHYQAH
jgi:diguanylate cyclase (GGDEF)-like protein